MITGSDGDEPTDHDEQDGAQPRVRRRLTVAEVDMMLLALPQFERDIYLAHRIGGRGYGEIAGRLGITIERVETAITFALFELMQAADAIRQQDH